MKVFTDTEAKQDSLALQKQKNIAQRYRCKMSQSNSTQTKRDSLTLHNLNKVA